MGQIAEDMINGLSCSLCGSYFIDESEQLHEHGHPAVCASCYEELNEEERLYHERSDYETL